MTLPANRTDWPKHQNDRYMPQAKPGGGWGVFDRLTDKFVSDAELSGLSVEALQSEKLPSN